MVYNKSKVTILTYYVRFSSQFCQWHNLNFKQLHQSLQVANLFFPLFKKKLKIYARHNKIYCILNSMHSIYTKI